MLDRLRTRKTILLALYISLLTFQSGGWFMAWHIARQEARHIARAAAPPADRQLYRLTLALRTLEQARVDKKEIRLNGHLYDIRSFEQHGDSATVLLYHDTREEALFAALEQLLAPVLSDDNARRASSPGQHYLYHLKWMQPAFPPAEESLLPVTMLPVAAELVSTVYLPGSQVECPRPGPPPRVLWSYEHVGPAGKSPTCA